MAYLLRRGPYAPGIGGGAKHPSLFAYRLLYKLVHMFDFSKFSTVFRPYAKRSQNEEGARPEEAKRLDLSESRRARSTVNPITAERSTLGQSADFNPSNINIWVELSKPDLRVRVEPSTGFPRGSHVETERNVRCEDSTPDSEARRNPTPPKRGQEGNALPSCSHRIANSESAACRPESGKTQSGRQW